MVVATVLDFEEGAGALARGVGGEKAVDGVDVAGIALLPARGIAVAGLEKRQDQRHQLAFALGADHEVHAVDFEDFLRFELRVAAGDGNPGFRRDLVQPADEVAAFLVGVFRHRTGVDHDDIHAGPRLDLVPSFCGELPREGGGLREIELAAQRDESGFFIHT